MPLNTVQIKDLAEGPGYIEAQWSGNTLTVFLLRPEQISTAMYGSNSDWQVCNVGRYRAL